MAKNKNILYCVECDEFINSKDLVYCAKCDAHLHIWCATKKWCDNYPDIYFCSYCAEELDEEECIE